MKTNHAQTLVQIEKAQLQQLCTEVKESLATDMQTREITCKQPFGVADLWNIHRNTRYRVQRRNLNL